MSEHITPRVHPAVRQIAQNVDHVARIEATNERRGKVQHNVVFRVPDSRRGTEVAIRQFDRDFTSILDPRVKPTDDGGVEVRLPVFVDKSAAPSLFRSIGITGDGGGIVPHDGTVGCNWQDGDRRGGHWNLGLHTDGSGELRA